MIIVSSCGPFHPGRICRAQTVIIAVHGVNDYASAPSTRPASGGGGAGRHRLCLRPARPWPLAGARRLARARGDAPDLKTAVAVAHRAPSQGPDRRGRREHGRIRRPSPPLPDPDPPKADVAGSSLGKTRTARLGHAARGSTSARVGPVGPPPMWRPGWGWWCRPRAMRVVATDNNDKLREMVGGHKNVLKNNRIDTVYGVVLDHFGGGGRQDRRCRRRTPTRGCSYGAKDGIISPDGVGRAAKKLPGFGEDRLLQERLPHADERPSRPRRSMPTSSADRRPPETPCSSGSPPLPWVKGGAAP